MKMVNVQRKALVAALLLATADAFVFEKLNDRTRTIPTAASVHENNDNDVEIEDTRRRSLLFQQFPFAFTAGLATAAGLSSSNTAPALAASDSPLFKPNPLTNGVLEQIRIWEQADADNLKYGGELERGDAGNKGQTSAYPKLLVPILLIAKELDMVTGAVQAGPSQYAEAIRILKQPKYDKIAFKRVFNAYADNIYYGDPDRANLYLAGGATPKSEQSLAYLLRNEILTNIEDMQAELQYLTSHPEESDEDLKIYATAASNAMQRYLAVVPPNELKQANELIAQM